jgi:hypothetical protein
LNLPDSIRAARGLASAEPSDLAERVQ